MHARADRTFHSQGSRRAFPPEPVVLGNALVASGVLGPCRDDSEAAVCSHHQVVVLPRANAAAIFAPQNLRQRNCGEEDRR